MLAQARTCLQACAELGTRGAFILATGRGQPARDGGGFLGVVADLQQGGLDVGGERGIGAIRGINGLRGDGGDALGLLQTFLPLR